MPRGHDDTERTDTTETDPALARAVRATAHTAATTDPDGTAPFPGIADRLATAAVVGLGEATHRTREFVRLKHRLLRYLVAEHDLRAIALEAPVVETATLNDYVVHGDGDARDALATVGYDIHETRSGLALWEWLRSVNRDRPLADRVAVHGIDVQSVAAPAGRLLEWAGEQLYPETRRALETATEGVIEGTDVAGDRLRAGERAAETLRSRLDRDALPGDGDLAPGALTVRRLVTALEQGCAFARAGLSGDRPEQWGCRDRLLSDNVARVRETASERSDGPVAVWAHDNHVKRERLTGDGHPARAMGDHLDERFGESYYALGLQFGTGQVRAHVPVDEDPDVTVDGQGYARRTVSVPEPEGESVPAVLSAVDAPVVLLDYRSVAGGPLSAYLDGECRHRFVAGTVDPDDPAAFSRRYTPRAAFDGVLFVQAATPTDPM